MTVLAVASAASYATGRELTAALRRRTGVEQLRSQVRERTGQRLDRLRNRTPKRPR
jgi:hypothetical protein